MCAYISKWIHILPNSWSPSIHSQLSPVGAAMPLSDAIKHFWKKKINVDHSCPYSFYHAVSNFWKKIKRISEKHLKSKPNVTSKLILQNLSQNCWYKTVGKAQKLISATLMFLICRLPSSCSDIRESFPKRLTPSFSQLMEGMGSPDAWHFNSATLSTPSVWLDGPWRIIGGGLSVSTWT